MSKLPASVFLLQAHATLVAALPEVVCPQFDWCLAGFAKAVVAASITSVPRANASPAFDGAATALPRTLRRLTLFLRYRADRCPTVTPPPQWTLRQNN